MLVNTVNNFIPTDSISFILAMSCTENILSNTLDVDRSSQSKLNTYLTKVTESLEAIVCDNTDQLLTMTSTIFQSALLLADVSPKLLFSTFPIKNYLLLDHNFFNIHLKINSDALKPNSFDRCLFYTDCV